MTITELRNKRAKTFEAAKAFLDSHRNADGFLSAEDDATYTNMENEITALGNEINRMERLEAMDREMSKPTSTPLTEKPAAAAKIDAKTGEAAKASSREHGRVYPRLPIPPGPPSHRGSAGCGTGSPL